MEFLKLFEILLRRKWIFILSFLIFFLAVVLTTHLIHPTYKGEVRLLNRNPEALTALKSALKVQGGLVLTDVNVNIFDTMVAMATIRPNLEKMINDLGLKDRSGKKMASEKIVKNKYINLLNPQPYIEAEQNEDGDMLLITAYSPVKAEAVQMANTLADLYIQNADAINKQEYKKMRRFTETRMQEVRDDFYQDLVSQKDFLVRSGTSDLGAESTKLIDKVYELKTAYDDNDRNINKYEKEMAEAEAQLGKLNKFRKESEEIVKNEQITALKTKIKDTLIAMASQSANLTEIHSTVISSQRELEKAKQLIEQEKEKIFNSEKYQIDPLYQDLFNKIVQDYILIKLAEVDREKLRHNINAYQAKLMAIPVMNVENSMILIKLVSTKNVYQVLNDYLKEISLAESLGTDKVVIVERAAEFEEPYFPIKKLNYLFGLVMGIFWALAIAFFFEYIDHTVKSPEDIRKSCNLPVLGVISMLEEFEKGVVLSDRNSRSLAAFRSIVNSMGYLRSSDGLFDDDKKAFVIASTASGEGKSTIAANLSKIAKMSGIRTVIVDWHLNRPALHRFFGIPNNKGLIDVLKSGYVLDDAIYKTEAGLPDVLTTGEMAEEELALVGSEKIKRVIDELKGKYDLVIIDTPPVMPVNDSVAIARFSDAVILVVESGKTSFSMLCHTVSAFNVPGITLAGVVLNKFNVSLADFNHYYYNYRY